MKTLNEAQMQVLEVAAKAGGASSEGLHHRTVASLARQGLIAEKRGRNDKHTVVATPAGVALLREYGVSATEAALAVPPALARAAQAPKPELEGLAKSKPAQAPEPMPPAMKPKSRKSKAAAEQSTVREANGKLGLLIRLLRQPEGATLAAMVTATGWQAHSVRGAMAGAIKKKLGLTVVSEKAGPVRSWRIVEARS